MKIAGESGVVILMNYGETAKKPKLPNELWMKLIIMDMFRKGQVHSGHFRVVGQEYLYVIYNRENENASDVY